MDNGINTVGDLYLTDPGDTPKQIYNLDERFDNVMWYWIASPIEGEEASDIFGPYTDAEEAVNFGRALNRRYVIFTSLPSNNEDPVNEVAAKIRIWIDELENQIENITESTGHKIWRYVKYVIILLLIFGIIRFIMVCFFVADDLV